MLGLLFALAWSHAAFGAAKKIAISSAKVATQLTVTTQSPADGQTVSGSVTWSVTTTGETPGRVDFSVDGVKQWSQAAAPYLYGGRDEGLDTTTLSNGSHTLTATAYGSRGLKGSSTVIVDVQNTAAAPAPEPQPEPEGPQPPPAPGSPLYWGATIGPQLTGTQAPWDMTAVTKFEEHTRKKVSLVQFFQPFSNCSTTPCSYYAFPTGPMENIRTHGAIPVLSWGSQSIPATQSEPDFQLSDVISGRYDSFIRSFATAAKAWGHPFFLRYDWEMNGSWFSWSEGVNGNQTGEFVRAWRHVHDIFTEVGATNATWVWCPNIDPNSTLRSASSLYPGDAYVDWTGLDGYNWGTNPAKPSGWQTFSQLYKSTYTKITGTDAPSKPLMIGEIASSEYGGSKASWIRNMLTVLPTEYPKIRALLWFDKFDSKMDWPIETSETATSAFAEGIQDPVYDGNLFGSIAATAIQPPS